MTSGDLARDPRGASSTTYDLVIVGGGIYGVAVAFEAARRGLRPLLLERDDFGGATSWNSLRILHGGLRYLQTFDLRRFRDSVGERRWMLENFPDLVEPLPCLMPLYNDGVRRPGIFRVALLAEHALSRSRNDGLGDDRKLPRGRVLTSAQTRALFPSVDRAGLKGGALWYDAAMPDSQRLLIELLRWACRCGAVAANYVEVTAPLVRDGRAAGVEATDRQTGDRLEFRGSVIVNCSGPWARRVAETFDRPVPGLFQPSLAFNLLLEREPLAAAALAVTPRRPGARTYFLHPWKGRILAGTFHAPWSAEVDEPRPDRAQVAEFLDDLNTAIPGLGVTEGDILRVHAGLLPATEPGTAQLATRPVLHDHGAAAGLRGLYSVSGVKFTTARLVAERLLRMICAREGWAFRPPDATGRPAPGQGLGLECFQALAAANPRRAAEQLRRQFREEAVLRPEDWLMRRTDWGVDPAAAQRLADDISRLLQWQGPDPAGRDAGPKADAGAMGRSPLRPAHSPEG